MAGPARPPERQPPQDDQRDLATTVGDTDVAPASAAPALDVYAAMFDAYPDGLLLVDAAGRIRQANPAASALFGYALSELQGMAVDNLVPAAMRGQHAGHRQGYAHNPRARPMGTQMELTALRRDGTEVMVEIALSPLPSSATPGGDNEGCVVAAVRGIGGYPRVQHALKTARYSEAVARMGRLAVTNREAHALLRALPEVAAKTLAADHAAVHLLLPSLLEFEVAAEHAAPMPQGHRTPNRPDTPPGFVYAARAALIVSDSQRETRFSASRWHSEGGGRSGLGVPLFDHDRVMGVLEVRAQTPRHFDRAEADFLGSLANLLAASLQRARTEEHLSHSQRMESVGQLTGGIAHDFNNLLTVIQGNLQVLGELPAVRADEQAARLVGSAVRASRRGADLTGKLLAFSRRQMLSPGNVDVHSLLESLIELLQRTLDENIRIELDAPDTCPLCQADASQLEATLLNIAINARDAMPSGGVLCFRLRFSSQLVGVLAAELDGGSASPNGYVVIGVSDSGTGMPEAVRQRAFEPFFTTKESGRGTGLGLSTAYGFVKQSRGAIALESTPEVGTTIRIALPAVAEGRSSTGHRRPGLAESSAEAASATSLPSGLRVLLVEDDLEVLEVAVMFLQGLGCVVTAFTQAEPALEAILAGEATDLLMSDVVLGEGMRGTELARRVRSLRPGLPVLLASGYSSEASRRDDADPPDLLAKPYDRETLQRAILAALGRREE